MIISENDMRFRQTRELTPQWAVEVNGNEVAIVTERIISEPPYLIRWLDENGRETGPDETLPDREAVMRRLVERLNGKEGQGGADGMTRGDAEWRWILMTDANGRPSYECLDKTNMRIVFPHNWRWIERLFCPLKKHGGRREKAVAMRLVAKGETR